MSVNVKTSTFVTIWVPVLAVLGIFTFILLKSGPGKRVDPFEMTDLERDGLKGPIQSMTFDVFSSIGEKIEKATYRYDRLGNRTEERYFDADGDVVERVVYYHDSDGYLYLTLKYTDPRYPLINATEKTYSIALFDINVSGIAGKDYYKEGRTETLEDRYGNWITRSYYARKSWKALGEKLYSEDRTLAYYDRTNNNSD